MSSRANMITFESTQGDRPENTLGEYVTVGWRRRWLIVSVAFGSAVAAAAWSYLQTPIYQAKATVVIEQEGPRALERDRYSPMDISPEYFQTHFELMRSHHVLHRTAQMLNLSEQQEYRSKLSAVGDNVVGSLAASFRRLLGSAGSSSGPSPEEREDQLLESFGQHISILPVRGARLAHITVDSEDPKFAALAANTLASVYIERSQELSTKSKEKAAKWFTAHLDELRKNVEASQQALYLFRVQHGLLEGQQRQTVAAHKLTQMDTEVVKAEMKATEARTRYDQIKSILHNRSENGAINWSMLDASTEVLNSPMIQSLRSQEIKVSGQVAELSEKYGPLHPKLERAKSELQDLRERLREEIQKIYDSVKNEHDAAVARERAITETAHRSKKEKIKLEQHEIEHNMLEREAESNQHLYDIFLKVAKEADLSSGLSPGNVYLADPAVPSSFPMKPKKKLNTMLGLLVGLMAGIGLALVLETRDRSLKGLHDLERYLPAISLLGVVPRQLKVERKGGALLQPPEVMNPVAESFRSIRTSVLRSSSGGLPSSLLVTSPGESEGKTTLALNLAKAMAQLEDMRVLLIDADLRKPNADPIFNVETKNGAPNGLAHFLMGESTLQEIVYQTNVANLSVIPRGYCPTNPSELLHSKHMTKLITWYRQEGYHVIIDAPPVLPVTDPAVLAPQVDGVLLVVSAGETTRESCRFAIQRLTTSGGKLMGIVLQKAEVGDVPYYSQYY